MNFLNQMNTYCLDEYSRDEAFEKHYHNFLDQYEQNTYYKKQTKQEFSEAYTDDEAYEKQMEEDFLRGCPEYDEYEKYIQEDFSSLCLDDEAYRNKIEEDFLKKYPKYNEYENYTQEDFNENTYDKENKFKGLNVISAIDLCDKNIPDKYFVVDNMIPAGLTVLAAKPKIGKSWLVLAMCMAVASGEKFLGYDTNNAECLYLALEDSEARIKDRLLKLQAEYQLSKNMHITTECRRIGCGLREELTDFLVKHPDTKLIVVDTLQCVRGEAKFKESIYASDYREVSELKRIADENNVAIVIVHHFRKSKDSDDAFDNVSGSNGLVGAADTIITLEKKNRADKEAIMSIVGRDIDTNRYVLSFNDDCLWENKGEEDIVDMNKKSECHDKNKLIMAIKAVIDNSDGEWSGTAQGFLDLAKQLTNQDCGYKNRTLGRALEKIKDDLQLYSGIIYERKSNGSGGGTYTFYRIDTNDNE